MKIAIISDTHTLHHKMLPLPESDVLIHCGDFSSTGKLDQVKDFASWFGRQNAKHKIIIAGNHDLTLEKNHGDREKVLKLFLENSITYIQDSEITFDGVKFYGSPWQPEFCNWAFNLPRGYSLKQKWNMIPDDTNVLITHGPPYGILDLVENNIQNMHRDLHQGCEELADKVMRLPKLKLHCFGHLHTCGGQTQVVDGKTFVNAAICDERYYPSRKPVVVEI